MKKNPLVVLVMAGLLSMPGCSDDEPKFVPGNILVGFKSGVTIRQAYDFAVQNSNDIGYIHGLYYYSNLPNDSLNYVVKTLAVAEFPSSSVNVRIGFTSNRIEIILNYNLDEDKSTLDEWIVVSEAPELKFEDMANNKSMLLYITPGTEKQWEKAHSKNSIIEYINLDYYIR